MRAQIDTFHLKISQRSAPNPPQSYTDALFKSLHVNQLDPETTTWLASVLFSLDSKDLEAYTGFMTPDVSITFNNGNGNGNNDLGPNVRGLDTVRGFLAGFWQGFETLRHEELNVYGTRRNIVHEAVESLSDAGWAGGEFEGGGVY